MTTPWSSLFTEQYPAQGASEADIKFLGAVFSPLNEDECKTVNASQRNPFPKGDPFHDAYRPFDPHKWLLPSGPFPESYLDFLRWSNGGSFMLGERRFDPFLSASAVREYLISYHMPQYMPGAIPFAFDGGGCFYVFDMRKEPMNGEYPILFADSGNLGYGDAIHVADTFPEAIKGSTRPRSWEE